MAEFLTTAEIERFLGRTPAALRDIVFELRNLVRTAAPQTCETIRWKSLWYFDFNRGGIIVGGVCGISPQADHVRLEFIHGAFLPDPHHLLEGTLKAKRFVRLASYEETPWDELIALIEASSRFNPRTLSAQAQ